MAAKRLDVCMMCDESPCVCGKPVKSVKPKTAAVVKPVVTEARVVKRVTTPLPQAIVFKPVVVKAPEIKKILVEHTDDEIITIAAIQNLAAVGLVTAADNPQFSGILTMKLSTVERAIAWKAMK